jgi:hypothetical protein
VTPLSAALTAAQRSALAALEKAYVAGAIEPEAMVAALEAVGISDPVDTAFLLAALDVLREWGVAAPTMSERVAEAKDEPASSKQLNYMTRLLVEKGVGHDDRPDGPFTKEQASEIINALQAGTYDPAKYRVPF